MENTKNLLFFSKKYLLFWYVYDYFACMHVGAPCACLVSVKARRRCCLPGTVWAAMLVLGNELGTLPDEPSLQLHLLLLQIKIFLLNFEHFINMHTIFWFIFISCVECLYCLTLCLWGITTAPHPFFYPVFLTDWELWTVPFLPCRWYLWHLLYAWLQ